MYTKLTLLLCARQTLIFKYGSSDTTWTKAVDKHLNPVLQRLCGRKLANNPDINDECYDYTFDGTGVLALVKDMRSGFENGLPSTAGFGLTRCKSDYIAALARVYKDTGATTDYDKLVTALPCMSDYAIAMSSALAMKPSAQDVDDVQVHMRSYVIRKAQLWPPSPEAMCDQQNPEDAARGSLTWYDSHMLVTLPQQMRKLGALAPFSNQGMEAWQKKLVDLLRTSNGQACCGRDPNEIKEKGEAARRDYRETQKAKMRSPSQWVYEQSALREHAIYVDELKQRDKLLQSEIFKCRWSTQFCVYWKRWMLACRILLKFRIREQKKHSRLSDLNRKLLVQHRLFWAPIDPVLLSAQDLAPKERAKQERALRRARYAQRFEPELVSVRPHEYLRDCCES